MVLSYLTSRAFACAAHQPRQLFSAARLQPSRDPLHREGLRPAESHVLGPHASLSHAQQVMPSRPSVNSRPAPPKPRLAAENTEGAEAKGEPLITGRVTARQEPRIETVRRTGRARLLPSPIYLPLFVAFVPFFEIGSIWPQFSRLPHHQKTPKCSQVL